MGYYGHRDGAIGTMLAAALLKTTYGTEPQFLVSTRSSTRSSATMVVL